MMVEARRQRKYNLLSHPPMPKLRKRTSSFRKKNVVLAAIARTRGYWTELAEEFPCGINTIYSQLHQPGWEDVLERFRQQKEVAVGRIRKRFFDIAEFSVDANASRLAAQEILQKLDPDFQSNNKVTIEGGPNPIKVQHVVLNIPAEILQYPVETRMAVLKYMEQKEKEMGTPNE